MKKNQIIKSVVRALLAALFFANHAQLAQADEPAKSSFRTFKTFGEAVSYYKDKGQLPHASGNVFSGYSLEPFGSRAKALAEAQDNAGKAGVSAAIITQDFQRTYDTPPPGTHWHGTYDVVILGGINPVEATPENLLSEIQHNPAATGFYLDLAKKAEFKGLTQGYREIIRGRNDENSQGISVLVQLIAFHDGKACGDDLLKWAKYHRNPDVRVAAYLGLIQFGRTAEVEESLKSESNNDVKAKVQKNLI